MSARKKPAKAKGRGKTGVKKAATNAPARARVKPVPRTKTAPEPGPVRRTTLTPELQASIALSVAAGAPIPIAAASAGVPKSTWRDWLAKGREGVEPYAAFVEAMESAKAAFAAGAVRKITAAGEFDWHPLAWLLERRFPHQFGRRQALELAGSVGVKAEIVTPPPKAIVSIIADPERRKKLRELLNEEREASGK